MSIERINMVYRNLRYRVLYVKMFVKYSRALKIEWFDVLKYSLLGSNPNLAQNSNGEMLNELVKELRSKYEYINGEYISSLDNIKVEVVNYEVLSFITKFPVVKYVRDNSSPDCKRIFNFYLYKLRE